MGKDIILKVHKSYRWVVAVCDEELLGRKLVDGKRALDLSGQFFKGETMNCDEVRKEVSRCKDEDATFNFVGKRSVKIAKELEIVNDESVIEIEGIPFALVLL
ncbi:MAG: DUF424 family protein [archaeon]